MKKEQLNRVLESYKIREKEFGKGTVQGDTGWNDGNSQILRFNKIINIIIDNYKIYYPSDYMTNNLLTLVDLGCGQCDFIHHWNIFHFPAIKYIGIDIRNPSHDFESFICDDISSPSENTFDILSNANIIIASGLFSFWPFSQVKNCIRMIYDSMKRESIFIFNILKKMDIFIGTDHTYVDPVIFLQFILKICKKYSLHSDYSEDDITISIRKD